MDNNTMVLVVHFDYSETHEYIVYRIKSEDFDAARPIIENTPERWNNLDDDCDMTYEELIDDSFAEANIWFEKEEYDVVRILDI